MITFLFGEMYEPHRVERISTSTPGPNDSKPLWTAQAACSSRRKRRRAASDSESSRERRRRRKGRKVFIPLWQIATGEFDIFGHGNFEVDPELSDVDV